MPPPPGAREIDTSPHVKPAAYVSADHPPIGGRIKAVPEDFLVEEIPLYQPAGEGEHIFLMVEKRGLTAMQLVDALSKHFRVRRSAIGYAGLKDKQAITRQIVSVHAPGKTPEQFPHFEHERARVLWADLHTNKLQKGHLAGNRFSIKIRDVGIQHVRTVAGAVALLERIGVPERVGPQRFGYLANNHLVGLAILRRDAETAINLICGPAPLAPDYQAEARAAFAAGDYAAARDAFPHGYRTERVILDSLANGEHAEQALDAVDPDVLGFYISAFQSAVFNAVLDKRILSGTLGTLLPGDVTLDPHGRHPTDIDEVSLADDALLARYAAMEFSASGPMWGNTMKRASGGVDRTEVETLADFGLRPQDLPAPDETDLPMTRGTRRPLRCALKDAEVEGGADEHGPYIRVAFDLPRGAFATTVLDEIMKPGSTQPPTPE